MDLLRDEWTTQKRDKLPERPTPMAHCGEYLQWAGYALSAVGTWRFLPLAVVRLTAAFTPNEMRFRQCLEVLRLSRRDAAQIASYVTTQRQASQSKAAPSSGRAAKAVSSGDGRMARRSTD
jgi:hypothetical protein